MQWSGKHILITGGTGFIGSRLAERCRERGFGVTVLGQENTAAERENAKTLRARGITLVAGSVTDKAVLLECCKPVDAVIHLAAAQHEANVDDQHFYDVNVRGTRTVLEAALAGGVDRVVHGSTIGVYGALDGEIDEDSPLRPTNIYGVTKQQGEEVVREFADRLDTVIVRISETYGPGDRRLLKLFRAIAKGAFFMIGRGENIHPLIYVDDLTDAILAALERPAAVGQTFVLAGGEALSTNAMVSAIAAALERTPPRLRVPLWPLLALAVVLETVLRPLGITPPLHRRRMDFFRKSFRFRTTRMNEVLGFSPSVDFAEGVRRTARWYRENGLLD